jgi:protein-S-isoprenylcysteine O-methyltransferase Ste14
MDTIRYVLGVMLVTLFPPALLYWVAIHPFARLWRKVGATTTYLLVIPTMAVVCALLYLIREWLLGADLGTNWFLAAPGLGIYVIAIVIGFQCRKHLSFRIVVGLPEVTKESPPGQLLQEGIYAAVRHPRYLTMIFATLGMALVINYLGAYVLTLLLNMLLYLIILLEERELLGRLGEEYADYQRRVPRLIPRFRRKPVESQWLE